MPIRRVYSTSKTRQPLFRPNMVLDTKNTINIIHTFSYTYYIGVYIQCSISTYSFTYSFKHLFIYMNKVTSIHKRNRIIYILLHGNMCKKKIHNTHVDVLVYNK